MLKKIYILFAIVLCCLCVVACKDKGTTTQEQEILKVGSSIDFPPFEYYDNGKIVGFEIDLINKIGEKINKKVVIEDMKFNTLFAALSSGKIDVLVSGADITEERLLQYDFTDGYYDNKLAVIVKEGDESIKSLDDLKGKIIGTQIGTTSDIYAETVEGATNNKYDQPATVIMNLNAGKVEVAIVDKAVAEQILMANEANKGCKIVEGVEIVASQIGMAVKKGNKELLDQLNGALKELKESGELDKLLDQYFNTSTSNN